MKKFTSTKSIWCCLVHWNKKRLVLICSWNLQHTFFLKIRLLFVYLLNLLTMHRIEFLLEICTHWKIQPFVRSCCKSAAWPVWTDSLKSLRCIFWYIILWSKLLDCILVRVIFLLGWYGLIFNSVIVFGREILRHDNFCWSPASTISSWSSTASSVIFCFGNIKGKWVLGMFKVLSIFRLFVKMTVLTFSLVLGL